MDKNTKTLLIKLLNTLGQLEVRRKNNLEILLVCINEIEKALNENERGASDGDNNY